MVRKTENNERFYCEDCGKAFRRHDKYQEHQRRHDAKPNTRCRQCAMKFLTQKALRAHELNTHLCTVNAHGETVMPFLQGPNGKYTRVGSADVLDEALESEKGRRLVFHCPVCAFASHNNTDWEVHIQVIHGKSLRFRPMQKWYSWKTPCRS